MPTRLNPGIDSFVVSIISYDRSLEREFYLMLDQPSMMLSKCQEESARFSAIHFSNIYMM